MDTKKSDDIPVTKKMLEETRDELKSDISSVKLDLKSLRQETHSGFSKVSSQIEDLTAAVHRSLALHEEQNARNKYVLDGYQNIHDRQERFEKDIRTEVDEIRQVFSKTNTTN